MEKEAASGVFRPPARFVIVHGSMSSEIGGINALCDSLRSVLALSLSLCGICRTPFIGILAGPYEEKVIFSLQHVRSGTFPAFASALERLRTRFSSPRDPLAGTDPQSISIKSDDPQTLSKALVEAVRQSRNQSQLFHQLVGYFPQLEVVLISSCPAYKVLPHLKQATQKVDLQDVKKILLVSVDCTKPIDMDQIDCDEPTAGKEQLDELAGDEEVFCEIIDHVSIKADVAHFQNVFKAWLQDDGTDREHVHLHLPDEDVSCRSSRLPVPLKCDLFDRIIPPGQLLQPANFGLQTSFNSKGNTSTHSISSSGSLSLHHGTSNMGNSRAGQATVELHHLRAISRVKSTGICESVLFGMPLLLRPTACWRLDWEELEHNQQSFQALCHLLQEQSEVLVAVQETNSPSGAAPAPRGHYIIMPCPTSPVLLVRPVATGELLLPINIPPSGNDLPVGECLSKMRQKLTRLEHMDTYNPLLLDCKLMQTLTTNLMQPTVAQGNSKKRKAPMTLQGNRKQSDPGSSGASRTTVGRYNQLAIQSSGSSSNSSSTVTLRRMSKPYIPPRAFSYTATNMYID